MMKKSGFTLAEATVISRTILIVLLMPLALCFSPLVAFAQQFDFYHGTDYESARWIYENRLSPQTLQQLGSQHPGEDAPWTKYTDFGKGFYSHVPGQYELARQWAERTARGKCRPGQDEAHWGVVIFHVDPELLRPIDVGTPERALYFPGKRQPAWNAPPSRTYPGRRQNWLEFVEVNRRREEWDRGSYGIQRPDDYDWSFAYAWIQGPIWVPRDSGVDVGGPIIDERVQQRNWLQQGLDQVLNNRRTRRELTWGTVPCPQSAGPNQFGVFLAKNDVLVGVRAELEAIPCCRLRGWGLDCTKTVGEVSFLQPIAGPFASREEATRWFCNNIYPGSYYRPPLASFLQGAKFRFDGENHLITNAPACR